MKPPLPRGNFPQRIETKRLILCRPDEREAALYAQQAQESCARLEPLSDDEARAFADFMIEHWDRYGCGFLVMQIVNDPASSASIGHVGFRYCDAWPNHWPDNYDEIELGYALVPRDRGKGYVTEGARAVLSATFSAFDVPYVRAKCNRENLKSAAVLLRCGMQEHEGTDKSRRFTIERPARARH